MSQTVRHGVGAHVCRQPFGDQEKAENISFMWQTVWQLPYHLPLAGSPEAVAEAAETALTYATTGDVSPPAMRAQPRSHPQTRIRSFRGVAGPALQPSGCKGIPHPIYKRAHTTLHTLLQVYWTYQAYNHVLTCSHCWCGI